MKTRVRRRTEQRDYHHSRADRAHYVIRLIAGKFSDAHALCWGENARLHDMVAGHQNLLTRHARLIRGCARYRAENQQLRRELRAARRDFAERQIALEDRLNALQAANENHYKDSAAAAAPIPPIAA
ncbi:hypothetical protein [Kitasatospora sp. NPDC001683]